MHDDAGEAAAVAESSEGKGDGGIGGFENRSTWVKSEVANTCTELRRPDAGRRQPGPFDNTAVLRLNAMRHLPNLFVKG